VPFLQLGSNISAVREARFHEVGDRAQNCRVQVRVTANGGV